jgi:sugar/nucleoside kinase (ribokinase family)
MTILVLGDANADLSAAIPRFPAEGDDSQITTLGWGSGGAAVNVATALALLGAPARLLARVGSDPAAAIALRVAQASGVDLAAIQIDAALATGLCFAAISPGGERTFFSYRGANASFDFSPEQAIQLDDARWLHISAYALLEGRQRAATLALLDAANERGLPISLDLCLPQLRAWRNETIELLPRLQILFVNEPELAALTPGAAETMTTSEQRDIDRPSEIGDLPIEPLLSQGVGTVALKLGRRGSLVINAFGRHYAPPFAVRAIDTNGCGDAYVAGFLFAHMRGANLTQAAILANALGALNATRVGAAEALPDRAALHAFVRNYPNNPGIEQLLST